MTTLEAVTFKATPCVVNIDHHNSHLTDSQQLLLSSSPSTKKPNVFVSRSHQPKEDNIIRRIKLRLLTPEDQPILKSLCSEWFPISYPDSWYNSITTNPKFDAIAAVVDDEIISVLVSETKQRCDVNKEDYDLLSSDFSSIEKVVYVLSLGVDSNYRRMGVASFMIRTLIENHKKMKPALTRAVYLHVLSTNKAAISFYERHGFQMLHFLRHYYVIKHEKLHGYSYVLYINGGKPTMRWTQCCRRLISSVVSACRSSGLVVSKVFLVLLESMGLSDQPTTSVKPCVQSSKTHQYRSI